MEEIWKEIKGYEGYYLVSSKGRVKSIRWNRCLKLKNVKGYMSTTLSVEGVQKKYRVHILVASAFIKKTKGKEIVNHIDGDKSNNCKENLEWVNHRENMIHCSSKKGYTGVYMVNKPWRAEITVNGKTKSLGNYCTENQAALAYKKYVLNHNLENKYMKLIE